MGGGGKSPSASSGEKALARISKDFYNQTDPMRQEFLDQGLGLLTGEQDIRQLPGFQMANDMAQEQTGGFFGQARDQILANTAQGQSGLQASLLGGAATAGAQQRSGLANQIAMQFMQDYIGKGYGLAAGAPQTAVGGLTGAAQAGTQRAQTPSPWAALMPNIGIDI